MKKEILSALDRDEDCEVVTITVSKAVMDAMRDGTGVSPEDNAKGVVIFSSIDEGRMLSSLLSAAAHTVRFKQYSPYKKG